MMSRMDTAYSTGHCMYDGGLCTSDSALLPAIPLHVHQETVLTTRREISPAQGCICDTSAATSAKSIASLLRAAARRHHRRVISEHPSAYSQHMSQLMRNLGMTVSQSVLGSLRKSMYFYPYKRIMHRLGKLNVHRNAMLSKTIEYCHDPAKVSSSPLKNLF